MKRRAFLIQALLLLVILLVLCLAVLGRQPYNYSSARQTLKLAQARALAQAGMEEVRVKLNKDLSWRRLGEVGALTYLEEMRDPISGERVGAYRVTVNQEWSQPDFEILRLESEGMVGELERPEARLVISSLLDLRESARDGTGDPNPDFFRWLEWNERIP